MSKKKELDRKKKISKLKEIASNVAKSVGEGVKEASKSIGTGGIAGAMANRDKGTEERAVKRYNSAPASNSPLNVKDGIISKGNFNSGSKRREDEEKKRRATGFR